MYLASLMHQPCEGLLPSVHLDHLHPVHNLVHQTDPSVSLASGSYPELSKLLAHPGLEGDCHHQQHNSLVKAVKLVKKGGFDETYHKRARTNPLVEKDSDNDKLQRSTPEVVVEEDRKVKPRQNINYDISCNNQSPIDIIGEKVDHLAHGGLAQGRVGELQGFSGFFEQS